MSALFRMSLYKLRTRIASSLVATLALVVGLWGIGTLIVSMFILQNDLPQNFNQTIPAHAILHSNDFNQLTLERLRQNPIVEKAVIRNQTSLRIEIESGLWVPLKLYSIDTSDNLEMDKFYKEDGDFRIPDEGILIERDITKVSSLRSNSVVRLQSKGETLSTRITGLVFDPGRAPSSQDSIVYGYTSSKYFKKLTGMSQSKRLLLRFTNVSSTIEVQDKLKKLLEYFVRTDLYVNQVIVPKFGEHPHQFQLNTLLYLNASIGFLAFLMSAFLVAQLMKSILAQEIRQIGIMKAIGGTRTKIVKGYAYYILAMTLVSILIGLPAAVWTGQGYAQFVAEIINCKILTEVLPLSLWIFLGFLGLLFPLLFSLPIIIRGTKLSVLQSIGDCGIQFETSPRTQHSTKRLNSLAFACRNIGRRKNRITLTMITMAFGVAIFATSFNVRASLQKHLDDNRAANNYDIKVMLNKGVNSDISIQAFEENSSIRTVQTWVHSETIVTMQTQSTSVKTHLVALPYTSKLINPTLISGRWLNQNTALEFVINQQMAKELYNPIIGGTFFIEILKKQYPAKLIGITVELDSPKLYVDVDVYKRLAPNSKNNVLLIGVNEPSTASVVAAKKEIESTIEQMGLDVAFVMSEAERSQIILDHLNIILLVLLFFALLVLFVSSMGMSSAVGINVLERTREIGVMRAIGATPRTIISLFAYEGLLVSTLSIFLGLFLALPLSWLACIFFGDLILGNNTPMQFTFSYGGFLATFLSTIFFAYVASRLPASKATKTSVREALRYQ